MAETVSISVIWRGTLASAPKPVQDQTRTAAVAVPGVRSLCDLVAALPERAVSAWNSHRIMLIAVIPSTRGR
jgi:hypothetical protein